MALARSLSVLLSVVVVSSLAALTGCSGTTIGNDLTTPVDPTDPTDPADPKPDSGPCAAIAPACDPGDDNVGSEANCKNADYCYSRTEPCNKTVVWCAHPRPSQCAAYPSCDGGDFEVETCPGGAGPGGAGLACYTRTLCGATILCSHQETCKALPACNAGDKEVTQVDTCGKPGVTCYSRSACNFTIYCYTP